MPVSIEHIKPGLVCEVRYSITSEGHSNYQDAISKAYGIKKRELFKVWNENNKSNCELLSDGDVITVTSNPYKDKTTNHKYVKIIFNDKEYITNFQSVRYDSIKIN